MSWNTKSLSLNTGVQLDTSGTVNLSDNIIQELEDSKRDDKLREERNVQDSFLQAQLKDLKALEEKATWGTYLSLTVIVGILGFAGYKTYKDFTK